MNNSQNQNNYDAEEPAWKFVVPFVLFLGMCAGFNYLEEKNRPTPEQVKVREERATASLAERNKFLDMRRILLERTELLDGKPGLSFQDQADLLNYAKCPWTISEGEKIEISVKSYGSEILSNYMRFRKIEVGDEIGAIARHDARHFCYETPREQTEKLLQLLEEKTRKGNK